jgi:hypothetical protein
MGTWCEDPWLKQVREWGYIPVLQPRTGLAPLRVLRREDKELRDIGSILDLFVSGEAPAPSAGPDDKSTDRDRLQSGKLKAGLGIHFLHGALELLGINDVSPRAEHQHAKSLRFIASDICVNKVELIALDRFLAAADVVDEAPTAMQLLTAEALFICTDVVKARELVVETESSHDTSIGVPPIPVHPGISASADVGGGSARISRISYRGEQGAVFGLKAVQVRFSDGLYRCLADPPGDLVVKRLPGIGGTRPEAEWLDTDAPFLNIQLA